MRIVQRIEGIAFTRFDDRDVVRHPLVQKIVKAYEAHAGDHHGVATGTVVPSAT
jgi:phosphate starvation-inducible PhoH-like protein